MKVCRGYCGHIWNSFICVFNPHDEAAHRRFACDSAIISLYCCLLSLLSFLLSFSSSLPITHSLSPLICLFPAFSLSYRSSCPFRFTSIFRKLSSTLLLSMLRHALSHFILLPFADRFLLMGFPIFYCPTAIPNGVKQILIVPRNIRWWCVDRETSVCCIIIRLSLLLSSLFFSLLFLIHSLTPHSSLKTASNTVRSLMAARKTPR